VNVEWLTVIIQKKRIANQISSIVFWRVKTVDGKYIPIAVN